MTRRFLICPKQLCFWAAGSEECEALLVVDILRRAGVEVTIAAAGSDKTVVTSHKVTVVTDALAADIDPADYDACILPGGIPGVNNLAADPDVRRVCDACNAAGKRVAAICAAPTVLAGFGLLEGRKATVYPGMDDGLPEPSTPGTKSPWTATSPPAAPWAPPSPSASKLAEQLAGKEASDRVRHAIVYPY